MKDGFMNTQNKAVWREMISLEDNATPLVTGEVDDVSRKKAFELHLENFRKGLLEIYSEEQVKKAMKSFWASFDYLDRRGFFEVKISLMPEFAWRGEMKTKANQTNVYVTICEFNSMDDAEPKKINKIKLVLPMAYSHYQVESAVWEKVKEKFPEYKYDEFLNSSLADLLISRKRKLYKWICCVFLDV